MLNMKFFLTLLATLFTSPVFAISDDFTQATDTNNWVAQYYACLTAGSNAVSATSPSYNSGNSNIPGCNYGTPDAPGSGALRLTPSQNSQHGAIVSNYTMPTNEGLQITFTTYTYGGDSGGTAGQGADGISFFLQDGAVGTTVGGSTNLGSWGGSLAYSCSNVNSNYTGLTGAYLGLGIDEYGNFLNGGSGHDNTATGILNTNFAGASTINGSNNWSSGSNTYQPNRIGLRGAGNVSSYWLNQNYPNLYTSSNPGTEASAVQNTCITGLIQNGGSGTKTYTVSSMSISGTTLTITTNSTLNLRVGDTINMYSSSSTYPTAANGVQIANTTSSTPANDTQYTVTSVDLASNSFTVNTTGTGTVSHAGNGRFTINVLDYAAIPGGYWVLPNTQKISNISANTRAAATPITYKLIITPSGYLTFMYNYNNTGFQTVLPNPNTPGALFNILTANGGSLPGSFRFGFAGSTGGSRNNHDITCFAAQPLESNSSVGANTVQTGQLQTNTQIYLASYNNNTWSGTVTATGISSGASGLVLANNTTWDANCVLTGGGCMSMGSTNGVANNSITVEAPSSRQLLTWNGTSGAALESGTITSAQQTLLNSTDSYGAIRLDWLRGGRGNELTATPTPGPLRARSGVLGDIVDSSPTFVGAPTTYTYATFTDSLYGGIPPEAAHPYSGFSTSMANRTNVVYAGSNDGLLHGFRAGNSSGTASNDGYELIGFMPSTVLSSQTTSPNTTPNVVALTNITYNHNYFVDGTPGTGDLYYGSAWHTWLAGGMGEGGKEIYILDITDPSNFLETNAATLVIGDWTDATISCTNASCSANMGKSYGTPIIRRLHNGQWAVIFGNGIGSSSGLAGVYVGLVSQSTGAITFYWLGTNSTTSNGISYVSAADFDGDHITDYLYAGDLQGNVWRFDLTSSNPADWGASKYGQGVATPLFTAKSSGGAIQPITSRILGTITNTGGAQRVILGFGTGSATPFTNSSGTDTYASGQQTVYGIWDWDFGKWNSGTTTAHSVVIPASPMQLASLTGTQTISRSNLLANSVTAEVAAVYTNGNLTTPGTRTVAQTSVCWQGSTSCPNTLNTSTTNNQYGWMFNLPDTVSNTSACGGGATGTCREQIVYNPTFVGGEMILNTTTPPTSIPGQCTLPVPGGWTMGFSMASGGGTPQDLFTGAGSGTGPSVVGESFGGVGTGIIMTTGGANPTVNLITSTGATTPPAVSNQLTLPSNVTVKRVSWEILR